MSDTTPPGPQQVRTLATALAVVPLVVLLGSTFVLGLDGELELWVVFAILLAVAVGHLLAERLGYRARPLAGTESGTAATESALRTYSTLMILRFVLTEAPLIVALALAFAIDEGFLPLVIAVIAGMPVLLLHTWPTARNVRRVADALEADGARSGLREAFGV